MSKQSGIINGAVRIDDKVFTAGMEEEFAEVATAKQIKHLTENEAVSGFEMPAKNESTDESDLPADLPGRKVFVAAGMNFEQVISLKKEDIDGMEGIGPKTVEALQAWAEANKPSE